jgi:hypothetical protein
MEGVELSDEVRLRRDVEQAPNDARTVREDDRHKGDDGPAEEEGRPLLETSSPAVTRPLESRTVPSVEKAVATSVLTVKAT